MYNNKVLSLSKTTHIYIPAIYVFCATALCEHSLPVSACASEKQTSTRIKVNCQSAMIRHQSAL